MTSHLRAPPLLQSTSVQPLVPPHPTSCSRVSSLGSFHCEVLGPFKISLSLLSLLTFSCLSFHVSRTSPHPMLLILRLSFLDLPFPHVASAATDSAAHHLLDTGLHGYLVAAPSWDCLFSCCSISPFASSVSACWLRADVAMTVSAVTSATRSHLPTVTSAWHDSRELQLMTADSQLEPGALSELQPDSLFGTPHQHLALCPSLPTHVL